MACISCVLVKRLRGEQFPASKFRLGRLGTPINAIAIVYLCVVFVFLFFPAQPNPSPAQMNWGSLIYGACCVFAVGYYYAKGRREYDGPVHYVKWQTQRDFDLET